MSPVESTFTTDSWHLSQILADIQSGTIQLPDFQRGWIWDDDHIRDLIESVSYGYPIGTVMLLETGGENIRFKPRELDGAPPSDKEPQYLILDGQQRLTSLFRSLYSDTVVETTDARKKPLTRWYYLKIQNAIAQNGDRAAAILSVPEDRVTKNFRGETIDDYSSSEREFESGVFPLNRVFDNSGWRRAYNRYWQHATGKAEAYDQFEDEVIDCFQKYLVPVIIVRRHTPKEAVCHVFEKVNTGGVSLTVFELLTASFAADDFRLRPDWEAREARLRQQRVLRAVQNTDFLQAVTLLVTYEANLKARTSGSSEEQIPAVSCRRREILRLSKSDYVRWANRAEAGFSAAARFLRRQHVFSERDLSYRTQLVPLAAVLAWLGDTADRDGIQQRLAKWFWCGVMGELYGSAVETRFAHDLPGLVDWLTINGPEPRTIGEANFVPSRLYTLRTRNSAAYKGIHALLMREGCRDLRSGITVEESTYFDDRIDIHHIFPRAWCDANGIPVKLREAIINKTAISARTNRTIGGNAPSVYVPNIARLAQIDDTRMDDILRTHAIDPVLLRTDDFHGFVRSREQALLDLIERAMGKPIAREPVSETDALAEDYEGLEAEDENGQ